MKDHIEISKALGISQKHAFELLQKRRFPSRKLAERLEEATGISRFHWLYPLEFDHAGRPKEAADA